MCMVGAFDGWQQPRRQLLWALGQLAYEETAIAWVFPADPVALPALSDLEALALSHHLLGLSTERHVMEFYRDWLTKQGVLGSQVKANQNLGQTHIWEPARGMVPFQSPETGN